MENRLYEVFKGMRIAGGNSELNISHNGVDYLLKRIKRGCDVRYEIKRLHKRITYYTLRSESMDGYREEGAILKLMDKIDFFNKDLIRVKELLQDLNLNPRLDKIVSNLQAKQCCRIVHQYDLFFSHHRDECAKIELEGYDYLCYMYVAKTKEDIKEAIQIFKEELA